MHCYMAEKKKKEKKKESRRKKKKPNRNIISLSCDAERLALTQAAEHDKQAHY